jgi:hypothetical protein
MAAATAVVLVVLIFRPGPGSGPDAPLIAPAAAPEGAPPDLSGMPPMERFNRLYQRIITGAQTGDQATVTRFMPMAVAAFAMLDPVTVDARYHMAMLHLHVGNLDAAASQADTVKRTHPDHLFGYVIGAAVARWRKDDKARDADYDQILQRYDAEMAKRLPEYLEHQAMLEELRRTATRGKPGATSPVRG